MKVGDRVKVIFPPYETGEIVRMDNPKINPYSVLVGIDSKNGEVGCFKKEHLKPIDPLNRGINRRKER